MPSPTPRYRQITCLTRVGVEKGDITSPFDKRFDIGAGETIRLGDISGPGRIVRFWMTLPVRWRGSVLRDAVLRMFWDNEPTPSVECPIGDFFGACFSKPYPFVSQRLSIAGGGYVCHFDMPFKERAIIEVENQSARALKLFVFQIGYYEQAPPKDLRTFHAQWRRQNPTIKGHPFVSLEARGKGRLVGLKIDMQNRSWWLRPPLMAMFLPRGLGLGMLEGPESLQIDQDVSPSVVGTGAEDFFQGGWYFSGGAFQTPTYGAIVRSFFKGRTSAYRFFVHDPIPFMQYLKLTFDHGLRNEIITDYSSVSYWYQEEPHAKFPALPPVKDRRPAPYLKNMLQPLLGISLLIFVVAIIVWLVSTM